MRKKFGQTNTDVGQWGAIKGGLRGGGKDEDEDFNNNNNYKNSP